MRSAKLILVLISFGVALIVAAVSPPDMNVTTGSSALGSWVMGIFGVVSLCTGLAFLRRGYLAARQARGRGPLPAFAKLALAFSGAIALAAITFALLHAIPGPESSSKTRSPTAITKAQYVEQEQQEIKRRQGNDKPARSPDVPNEAQK